MRKHFEITLRDKPLPPTRHELIAGLTDTAGLLCQITDPIDSTVIASAKKLRVISNMAVGVDNIDVLFATQHGIPVGHTPGVLTDATADLAVALMLAAARCFREGLHDATTGAWKTWQPTGYRGQDLLGKTLGIIGLGRIGSAVARRCRGGWGMRILYHAALPSAEAKSLDAELVPLDQLLRESDFISLHCPLTPQTRGLIGESQFRMMKPTAVFINTARGQIIDQKALIRSLQEKWIFSAGLDVTDPEPPDPSDPLLQLPNLVIMPHVGSATQSTRDKMTLLAADNLIAGLAGLPLPHSVNSQVSPRK